uniref:Alternative protein CDH8 n=1 Tax=Homo sapiens TaxID=9606 RepID=L8E7B0_HUMAN|nr:alternative protein CDH8 [Homo sapiens]
MSMTTPLNSHPNMRHFYVKMENPAKSFKLLAPWTKMIPKTDIISYTVSFQKWSTIRISPSRKMKIIPSVFWQSIMDSTARSKKSIFYQS